MLQARCIFRMQGSVAIAFSRTYLSQEYKTIMEKPFTELPPIDRATKKLFGQSEGLLPFELDSFVSKLPANDERKGEVYEQLLKLRSSEHTTIAPETINHAVIKYLMASDVDDLLSILSNKMQYGIFLDSFSGCYLMDNFLEKGNISGAAQIAVELMLQEDFENEIVQAFALKSCHEYAKKILNEKGESSTNAASQETEEKTEKPVKVRVKFLRNSPEKEMINSRNLNLKLMGRTLAEFSKYCSKSEFKQNGKLLGNLLENKLEDFAADLANNSNLYYKDILELSGKVLEQSDEADKDLVNKIKSALEKSPQNTLGTYTDAVEGFIKEAVAKNEANLISTQSDNYKKWIEERQRRINEIIRNQSKLLHKKEIETTVAEIESKKQHLWFFENQDKLDLEIFQKQVRYPKRWFGKKKKPRAIDDNYVPPEIRTK